MKALFLALLSPLTLFAQAPGVKIIDQSRGGLRQEQRDIREQLRTLTEDGEMMTFKETLAGLEEPSSLEFELPEPHSEYLSPTEIAETVAKSSYRVGWGYLCKSCDQMHLGLAGGYAISTDGVIATCAHVIDTEGMSIREGGLIAVDQNGKVFPVTTILAFHEKMDAALVKIDAETTPLPLSDQVRPGDAAYCLSRPLGQRDYFSTGMVNRFFWNHHRRGKDDTSLRALGHLKLNVSSRWAQGSSGSAVVDAFGNAIGHVALIQTLGKSQPAQEEGGPVGPKKTMITLHTATPARAVKALAEDAKSP